MVGDPKSGDFDYRPTTHRPLSTVLFSAILILAGCNSRPATSPVVEIESRPLAGTKGGADIQPQMGFAQLPAERTGIDFVHQWTPADKHAQVIDTAMCGGGVCLGDYDGDGQADVYLTRPHGGNRLYRNLGDFRFEDVTRPAGLDDNGAWGTGASLADIDNDGDLDLFVCGYDCPNRLFVNQGDGTFREQAKARGLDFSGSSVMMALADYDLDGDLDVYLVTNSTGGRAGMVDRHGIPRVLEPYREIGDILIKPDGTPKEIRTGQKDHLYRNHGDGTFSDVSGSALILGSSGNHIGLSATWWDYNHDGLPDLYVANDFWGPDQLFRNNGDGTLTDVIASALPHTPWFSMGADTADLNNDGRLDLMASDMSGTTHYKQKLSMGEMEEDGWFLSYPTPRQYMRNAVYLNTGTERFMEVAYLTGLADTDWTWSIKFADLDNDGWEDLFITNGMTRDWFNSDLRELAVAGVKVTDPLWLNSPKRSEHNLAFRNLGGLKLDTVGPAWGLDSLGVSFGAALADLDRDGDLDLVVNNFEEPVSIYRNLAADRPDSDHRVLIQLVGTVSNRSGIGAMLRAQTASGTQIRYLTLARGFMAANEPLVHFGLGDDTKLDQLTIEWPSGHVQQLSDLAADRRYTITEPAGRPPTRAPAKREPKMFAPSERISGIQHKETGYDDYDRQPLLPQRLSRLGPGMAWGDVDGDGDEDLYVGGASGHSGALYRSEGRIDGKAALLFEADQDSEDMAPLFFDVDGDGDLDLYVVSGGVECEPQSPLLRDRLYLNDGTGQFDKAPEDALPDVRDSGSCAAAADFDRDGDLDLFVGGRSIPGQYPETPRSRLLQNDRGRLTDVTDLLAPELGQTGLVTSAVWSDADGDDDLDLLVTHEWGPVKLYQNDEGRFVDRTVQAQLADRLGWYNGIAARDLDNDGDIDYVVTNFGLNTKYRATVANPCRLYYGDFDKSGRKHLVEASYEHDVLYPVRGKSCSSRAMPLLGEKFTTFDKFASATLPEIYTTTCLADAQQFEINSLESGVLTNDGKGRFTFEPLPYIAQASPGFGVVATEVDGDGLADIYLVQNFFGSQPETGRMDGGLSLLLIGQGNGKFQPVFPDRSGLVVPGDAKGLSCVDLNNDSWIDFVVGVNNGPLMAFENRGAAGQVLAVQLQGRDGNPTGVGARVRVELADGSAQTAEVQAGGSYLTQSTSTLVFGMGASGSVKQIEVRWPDGNTTTTGPIADRRSVVIRQPDGL